MRIVTTVIGLLLLLLSICLHSSYAELGRLVAGGVIAPASVVMNWLAMIGGLLLLVASAMSQWTHRHRMIVRGAGVLGLALALAGLVQRLSGPSAVTVHYSSGAIELEATLRLPKGAGPFPAVVIVHGSAPFKRGFYSQWADSLVNRGIAVLVSDKRGVGGSGGENETRNNAARANLELLAGDIVAGVRFLRTRPAIDPRAIGLLGISQGGWVGPLAATQDSTIAFLVLLSGPATSTGEESTWSELRGDHDGPAVFSVAASNDSLSRTAPRGFNPRPVIAGLRMPSLWLFGEEDNSVPTAKSVAALDSLQRAGAPVARQVFPGADHVMTRHDGPLGLMYTDPTSWDVWLQWIQETAKPSR
jgi:hypothetical protein